MRIAGEELVLWPHLRLNASSEGSEFGTRKLDQKRCQRRVFQPAFVRTRRILQRFQPVQYQESSLAPEIAGKPFAFVPLRARRWVRVVEPPQSLVDEQVSAEAARSLVP